MNDTASRQVLEEPRRCEELQLAKRAGRPLQGGRLWVTILCSPGDAGCVSSVGTALKTLVNGRARPDR